MAEDYVDRFETLSMTRRGPVLEVRMHTDDGPLVWGRTGNAEFPEAFAAIAADPDLLVVIITGTGERFSGPAPSDEAFYGRSAREWTHRMRNGALLVERMLDIQALVIAAVNGPAYHHPEIALMADIVLGTPDALFRDFHFPDSNMVPGDAVGVIFPLLMGANRARHFLLTGTEVTAQQAHDWGLLNEILPTAGLMDRARELADDFARKNPMVVRYTRQLFTRPLKEAVRAHLDLGLALEGIGMLHETQRLDAAGDTTTRRFGDAEM